MERRLAAILAADVVGYSKLMAEEEAGTLAALKAHRADIFDPLVAKHKGRIVKLMGDGVLVEFASVVNAVQCGIAIQQELSEIDSLIKLRIGINLGDIIVEGDDIYGDGVNVAARLEGLADTGGVCVSRDVVNQVRSKVDARFEDLGSKEVKNIPEPVQVFRVLLEKINSSDRVASANKASRPVSFWVAGGATVGLVLTAAVVLWERPWQLRVEPAVETNMDHTQSKKPSIAVLPFNNMSNDESQEYFSDGMSEDLITDLSKISGLFVIARNSSFSYKGKHVKVRQIAKELGVRYVLEGSVRRVGDQVRINAQLIDATTGGHLWAERYDGSLADVFSVQDDVTGRIIEALKLQLTPSESRAVDARGTNDSAAYDEFLRGLELLSSRRAFEPSANRSAKAAFDKAIQIDPEYAMGYAGLAWANWLQYSTINYYEDEPRRRAFKLAEKSLSLENNALAYRTLAKKHFTLDSNIETGKRPDLALSQLEAAAKLEPNNSDVLADIAEVLPFVGRPREALEKIEQAIKLNPKHPEWYLRPYSIALLFAGKYEKSARNFETWLASSRTSKEYYTWLAAAWSLAGKPDRARQILDEQKIVGSSTFVHTISAIVRKWPLATDEREILVRGLRLAGLPD